MQILLGFQPVFGPAASIRCEPLLLGEQPWQLFKIKKPDSTTILKKNLKKTNEKGKLLNLFRTKKFVEENFEAGLELRGWEVKSIRAGGASIKEAHVFVRNGELFLLNANITPLKTASTHEKADPTRNRKLLLHKHEIMRLIGRVEQAGYSLIPLDMHFKDGRVKLELGLGKGKKLFEKRADIGKREWKREQGRLLKNRTLNRK